MEHPSNAIGDSLLGDARSPRDNLRAADGDVAPIVPLTKGNWRSGWRLSLAWAMWCGLTSTLLFAGIYFGRPFFRREADDFDFLHALNRFDATHLVDIIDNGYHDRLVAFFPATPLAGWAIHRCLGLDTVLSLLIFSNACLLLTFGMMATYLRERASQPSLNRGESTGQSRFLGVDGFTLVIMSLFPTTFFFRMPYTEPLFLLTTTLAMYGMLREWSVLSVALIVGLATCERPVGVSLLLPLAWYVAKTGATKAEIARRLAYALPVGAWGLLAYMAYLLWLRGEPFSFATEQSNWYIRNIRIFGDKIESLASWEPIWSVYVPGWSGWGASIGDGSGILAFANPIFFVGAGALVCFGAYKRWLTSYEVLLTIGLLGIPYVTRAYEMCMRSHARYAAVVFPAYIVLAHLLLRLSKPAAILLLAASAALMILYGAMYASNIMIF